MQEPFVGYFCPWELLWLCWGDLQGSLCSNISVDTPPFLHPSPCPEEKKKKKKRAKQPSVWISSAVVTFFFIQISLLPFTRSREPSRVYILAENTAGDGAEKEEGCFPQGQHFSLMFYLTVTFSAPDLMWVSGCNEQDEAVYDNLLQLAVVQFPSCFDK